MIYQRNDPKPLDPGQGALLGAATGLVAALLGAVFGFLLSAVGISVASIADQQIARDYLPSLAAGGLAQGIGLVFNLVFYSLFGALGGLIGVSVFKKK